MADELKGQIKDARGKCTCERCGKKLAQTQFYSYKDKSKCKMCKSCLTAHVDNFNPDTFMWILQDLDVPYSPLDWNKIRDNEFAKDPYKMTGLSVLGKYLSKMKLNQFNKYGFAQSQEAIQAVYGKELALQQEEKQQKEKFQAELKEKLEKGEINQAEYKTLVSTETQKKDFDEAAAAQSGNVITGEHSTGGNPFSVAAVKAAGSYEQALSQIKNPYQQQYFIPEEELVDPAADLSHQDKIYLATKWGRLYKPSQWLYLQQMYTQFMNSFDIQGAARIDTLKKICKTSLKMDQAIDQGDIDTYQKLSRVYDAMMKSAKFTEAQNKAKEEEGIDSISALVDFVQANSGAIPKYICDQPQDIVDQIIKDLKNYNKNLIYEDKSLAQEIEKYLKNKQIAEQMKKDRQQAKEKGLDVVEVNDDDLIDFKETVEQMKKQDNSITDEFIQKEYQKKRVNKSE